MDKNFSREGGTAQSKNTRSTSFFAPLLLCVSVLSLVLLSSATFALAQNKSARFDPNGSFWILGEPPNEFSNFTAINLNAKRLRRLPSPGVQENDGATYRFKTVTVKRDNFSFTTMTRGGVSYSFSGKFLKGGNFAATGLGDETPVLQVT